MICAEKSFCTLFSLRLLRFQCWSASSFKFLSEKKEWKQFAIRFEYLQKFLRLFNSNKVSFNIVILIISTIILLSRWLWSDVNVPNDRNTISWQSTVSCLTGIFQMATIFRQIFSKKKRLNDFLTNLKILFYWRLLLQIRQK